MPQVTIEQVSFQLPCEYIRLSLLPAACDREQRKAVASTGYYFQRFSRQKQPVKVEMLTQGHSKADVTNLLQALSASPNLGVSGRVEGEGEGGGGGRQVGC